MISAILHLNSHYCCSCHMANVDKTFSLTSRTNLHCTYWLLYRTNSVSLITFLKSMKLVPILVQCNTTLSKNYITHSVILCDRLNLRKKQVCLHSLAVCVHEISHRTRIFHKFMFDNKALETFVEFRICWNAQSSQVVEFKFEHLYCAQS